MKIKTISLIALSLGVCSGAFATDYKSPEFNEDYKVEGAVKADRGIASEETDREPSSVVAKEKKKVEEEKAESADPQPWRYLKGGTEKPNY